jgi:hypothetical protein
MKVRTLGLMRDRASQRTMVASRTPQARPKALVHDLHEPECEELDFAGLERFAGVERAEDFAADEGADVAGDAWS